MINGVLHIVAAVLFAVVSVQNGMNIIWMGIAGVYLVTGVINLAIHALKIRKMEKAAKNLDFIAAAKHRDRMYELQKLREQEKLGDMDERVRNN